MAIGIHVWGNIFHLIGPFFDAIEILVLFCTRTNVARIQGGAGANSISDIQFGLNLISKPNYLMPAASPSFTLVSAVNSDSTLQSCLLQSPELAHEAKLILRRNHPSAALAYNQPIREANTDVIILIHQDVYLPPGWFAKLRQTIQFLNTYNRNWAVLGVWGVKSDGEASGLVYCNGLARVLGAPFTDPVEVRTLDEVVLILNTRTGLTFDENLPGYHFYGTDICLQAVRQGFRSYSISTFCVHNTNGLTLLPYDFWRNYMIMRHKWQYELPITTPCTTITRFCVPMVHWNVKRMINIALRRSQCNKRTANTIELYTNIIAKHPELSFLKLSTI